MPIYQRPNSNIKRNRLIQGIITDVTDSPVQGAVVVLRRKGSQSNLRYTKTDSQGKWSFIIQADGEFEVAYVLSNNPSGVITKYQDIKPGVDWSYYALFGTPENSTVPDWYSHAHNSVTHITGSYTGTGGSPETRFEISNDVEPPRAEVIDTSGYTSQGSYGFAYDPVPRDLDVHKGQVGEGAEIEVSWCEPGEKYQRYGSAQTMDEEDAEYGRPLNKLTLKSFGRGYYSPLMKITGTQITYSGSTDGSHDFFKDGLGSPPSRVYFFRSPLTQYWTLGTTNIPSIMDYNDPAANLEGPWGVDRSLWSVYNYNNHTEPQGERMSVALAQSIPGKILDTNFDNTYNNQPFIDNMSDVGVMKQHGMQVYYTLIYGAGGTPQSPTAGSFVEAYNQGLISLQELDIMKGYLGRHYYVEELSGASGLTAQYLTDCGNFFYQMAQAVETTVNNAGNGFTQWNAQHPDAISNNAFVGYLQYYTLTFVELMKNIATEYESFHRQSKGSAVSTNQYSQIIYPIFQKAGITQFTTDDGNNTRTYIINNSGITY